MYDVSLASDPAVTSTFPSGSRVTVGYHRRNDMSGPAVHVMVTGSKMLTCGDPRAMVAQSCPPATNTRPSGRTTWPEQKMSFEKFRSFTGTGVNVSVAGSQTRAD